MQKKQENSNPPTFQPDPIQFDYLAVGPFALQSTLHPSSSQRILGGERIDVSTCWGDGGNPLLLLLLASKEGLIRTWRVNGLL